MSYNASAISTIRRAGTPLVLEGQNLEGGTFVWGPRRGSEATERGEGVGGGYPPPRVGTFSKIIRV